jgi:hypothetical protein
MYVSDVPCAVGVDCCWHNESRGQEIGKLDTHVVVAVSKRGQFHYPRIMRPFHAEHLREDRVRHRYVQSLRAGIRDAEPDIILGGEVMVEALEKRLTRGCANGGLVHLLPNPLYEDL